MKVQQMDAYRYFFPAGWVFGIWGVILWILFPWNLVSYPGIVHPEIMVGGFFLCFVCGFLMTAAPKFTSSFGPTKADQNISFLLIALLFLSLSFSAKIYFYAVVCLVFLYLIYFLATRFLQRRSDPPDSFLFVAFGLISGLTGSSLLFLDQLLEVSPFVRTLGRLLFLQAYILCLVLGVGSRLIPALLGWGPLPTEVTMRKPQIILFGSAAILFLFSFFLEASGQGLSSQVLRSVVVTFIAIRFWKIHKLPVRRAYQSWWIWISAYFVVLGHWGVVFFLPYRIHFIHLILVSGLALMTLMIASRVTLSHGKHNMKIEKDSKALFVGALLLCGAGATRASAGIAAHIYQSHLNYASYLWVMGLIIWGWQFLPKIFKVKNPDQTGS